MGVCELRRSRLTSATGFLEVGVCGSEVEEGGNHRPDAFHPKNSCVCEQTQNLLSRTLSPLPSVCLQLVSRDQCCHGVLVKVLKFVT